MASGSTKLSTELASKERLCPTVHEHGIMPGLGQVVGHLRRDYPAVVPQQLKGRKNLRRGSRGCQYQQFHSWLPTVCEMIWIKRDASSDFFRNEP